MIPIEYLILITVFPPLLVCATTPFLSGKTILRDLLGPIGGLVSSWGSIKLVQAVLDGEQPKLEFLQISEGISIGFTVTPLGALFGLVASVLWIFAGIYSVGYMRGNKEKSQTRFSTFYALAVHAALCIAYASDLLTLFIFMKF